MKYELLNSYDTLVCTNPKGRQFHAFFKKEIKRFSRMCLNSSDSYTVFLSGSRRAIHSNASIKLPVHTRLEYINLRKFIPLAYLHLGRENKRSC